MFQEMTNGVLKDVYTELWGNGNNLPGLIEKTPGSEESFQFNIPNDICSDIKNIFEVGIDDFDIKFKESCFGQGNEYKEVNRLHSSALCALLIFSGVSTSNPLILCLNGKECEFSSVLFEYKNKVIGFPSNIDIVLVGKYKKESKSVILFLESKFSEYLKSVSIFDELGRSYVRNKYSRIIYNDSFLEEIGLQFCRKNNNEFEIFTKKKDGKLTDYYGFKVMDKETYLEGIKQMISHYVGIEHFVENDLKDVRKLHYCETDTDVYLGEILFDFSFETARVCLDTYSTYYKKLANKLNEINPSIHVVDEILKYSLFKENDYTLPQRVRNYYKL